MRRLLPRRLPVKAHSLVHLSEEGVRNAKRRLLLWLVLFYGGEVVTVGVLSFLIALVLSARGHVLLVNGLLLLGPILLRGGICLALHDDDIGARGGVGIVGVLGYCGGTWSLAWRRGQWRESFRWRDRPKTFKAFGWR